MSIADVTPEQILHAMQRVPAERWSEALQAIESLQTIPPLFASSSPPVMTGVDLQDSALIGIWAERTDLGEGHEFARELRRHAEQRDR